MNTRQRIILLSMLAVVVLDLAALGQGRSRSLREKEAAASLRYLLNLRARLEKIPLGGEDREPHKGFVKRNMSRLTYDDPSARYLVRSEAFWRLRDKYKDLAIADDIAWAAAENQLPGECEGDMICGIQLTQETLIRYLEYHPRGKHVMTALGHLKNAFVIYADESQAGVSFSPPEEAAGRSELLRRLRDMEAVLTRVPGSRAISVRAMIRRVADRYR